MEPGFKLPNVGICGDAGAGKDTLAHQLAVVNGYDRRAFADQLKIDVSLMLVPEHYEYSDWARIDYIDRRKHKPEMRALLQAYGVFMRTFKDSEHWVNAVNDYMKQCRAIGFMGHFVIPDVRFPNEVQLLRDHDEPFVIVKIVRPSLEEQSTLTDEQKQHISERALDDIEPDFTLTNDATPYDLYLQFMRSFSQKALQRV